MTPFLLDDLVTAAAERGPERVAVRFQDDTITYAALDARVNGVAQQLIDEGVAPGDRVGLFMPKSVDAVVALLGILRAGAAYVPLDPAAPVERVRYALEHCGVRVLFVAGRPKKLADKADPPLPFAMIAPTDATAERPSRVRTDQDLAYVLYTSGSTGAPKGVAITHLQSMTFVRSATSVFAITGDDAIASHAPFNFDLSIIDLFCAFAGGAKVVLIPEKWIAFPAKLAELVEAGVTVWNSVPAALVQLLDRGGLEERDLSRLRLVMFAGEPFPTEPLKKLKATLPSATLMNVYGQTEANSSTYHVVDEVESPLPIGEPFPNYEVLLIENDAEADEGEIYVVGGAVASGYYRDPERTAKAFVPHPLRDVRQTVYRTGDRAARDIKGRLIFKGRNDDAIKVRGYRVELGELEGVACSGEGVEEAAAVATPDAEAGHLLHLFVIGDVEAARARLQKMLPKYMQPTTLEAVDTLPRTANGKVDRRALLGRLS